MKLGRISAAIGALVLLSSGAPARDALLDKALAAFKSADYAAVVSTASQVASDAPDYAKAQYLIGEAQLLLAKPEDAERAFKAVLAVHAESQPGRIGLGRALAAQNKLEDAQAELRRAVAADAKDAQAHRALGDVLVRRENLKEAKSELVEAYKLAPKDPWIARSYVELLARMQDDKEATRVAKALAKARPEHPMGAFLEGVALERTNDVDEAIKAYEAALKIDDTFLDAHKNLAILCHTMSATYTIKERVDKALAHYERYFALGGKDPELESAYRSMKAFLEADSKQPKK
jgi:tetratricopeptide (TPR) repeat protein